MLELRHINKIASGKKILVDVSCAIERGSIAVFLGPSGVGKSTLLRVLNNLETIDSGSVVLDGKNLDLHAVNKTHVVGMVFQQFALFENLSVLENITLPLMIVLKKTPQEAKQIAHHFLREYQLIEHADRFIGRLSGGQKQRLSIVRTLAMSPKVICMDEPTSALDPLLTSYVAKTIIDLKNRGYYVLLATHDTGLVKQLPAMLHLMKQGTIVESASSEDFFAHQDRYKKLQAFMSGSEF